MRLVSLIVALVLASVAQANPPAFAPCVQSQAVYAAPAFSFQYQAFAAPVYQQRVFAAPVYQQRVFAAPVYSQRAFAVPAYSQRAFAVPVASPGIQVNVDASRSIFGRRRR